MVGPTVSQQALESGGKWFAYSGSVAGDVTVPAAVDLITIQNSGLVDWFVKVFPFFGVPIATGPASALGLEIILDGVTIVKSQPDTPQDYDRPDLLELFIPRQSVLEVKSINTAANNDQERGVALLAWGV